MPCTQKNLSNVTLSGSVVKLSDKMLYLGVVLLLGLRLAADLTSRIMKFHAALSAVFKDRIVGFEHIYVHVILAKCLPILFYDLDCVNVNSKFV